MQTVLGGRSQGAASEGRGHAPSPAAAQASPPTAFAAATAREHQSAAQLGSRLGRALRALDQPGGMSGVRIKFRYRAY